MNLPNLSFADLLPLLPALLLVVGASLLLLTEVFLAAPASRGYQVVLATAFAVAAALSALHNVLEPAHEVFLGFGVLDPFSSFLTFILCVALALASLTSAGFLRKRGAERGEFYALMLFATAGMSLLALSNELITLFVNLEVLSVATYALTAYLRRGTRPSEAGFKYFILGSFSSAVLLYGAALLYGATGTTHLSQMSQALPQALQAQPALVACGAVLVGAGFAFKIAAVPFHMWTPDVYEGAPTPVTALMSAGVKAAAFAALVRVFLVLAEGLDPKLLLGFFTVLALITMVVGNLLALPQRNVKRMLAYSSVAHAGYLLLGVATLFVKGDVGGADWKLLGVINRVADLSPQGQIHAEALKGLLFYLLAYTVTTIGAFALLSVVERREDENKGTAWDLERFSGMAQRRPGWAMAMALFMLSLGGIPPTVGFMGKLLIFGSAIDAGLVGLAVVGVLTSAASVYYYLRVVVYMYMRPAPEGSEVMEGSWTTELAVVICSVAVLALGVLPGALNSWLTPAATLFR